MVKIPRKYESIHLWLKTLSCPEMDWVKKLIKIEEKIRERRLKDHEKKVQNVKKQKQEAIQKDSST